MVVPIYSEQIPEGSIPIYYAGSPINWTFMGEDGETVWRFNSLRCTFPLFEVFGRSERGRLRNILKHVYDLFDYGIGSGSDPDCIVIAMKGEYSMPIASMSAPDNNIFCCNIGMAAINSKALDWKRPEKVQWIPETFNFSPEFRDELEKEDLVDEVLDA